MKTYLFLCSGKIEAHTKATSYADAVRIFDFADLRLCMNTEVVCLESFQLIA